MGVQMVDKTITGIVTWLKNWFPLKSELGTVATSNNYNDLDNKPNIPSGVVVDTEMSSTSTNAVQNKVIQSALNGKANSSHTHTISNVTNLQTTLDGKANSSHTHTKSEVTDFSINMPKFIDGEITLTSTVTGHETLRLGDDYFFQNKNNDWAVMGEIKVSGEATRFEVQVPTNTDAYNLIALGKNTNGNLAIWWSTSNSTETSHVDANVIFDNDTWYPFSIVKRDNTITFNFNNTKHHAQLPDYMNQQTYLAPQLRKWRTNNVSVRSIKIIPNIIDPVQDVTTDIDFNDYKKEGKYLIWASHQTSNINAPDTQGGLLEVEIIPNGVKQTLTQYYVANPKIYYRIFHATAGWREWEEVMVTSDVINNLTSTSTTAPLSANQGKVLKDSLVWKTQALTNMSGCTLYYNDLFCVLQVAGSYTISKANAYTNLVTGTIPSAYRPSYANVRLSSETVLIRVKLTDGGNVQYYSPQTFSSTTGIYAEFVWKR